ncbi:MAG: LytTR family transcriptional regulator DNA-binding domain-containing protein [Proteiniphilum sp.]|jgi:DNA-binding LytR/AlgR family response regulator|nr:LytTR family transcriptional regulator DNA-binding domain-containing protein [Proteiniphilum sp.]
MKLSLFSIPVRLLPVVLFCITYAVLHALAFHPIVTFPFVILLLKSAADSLIFVGLGMLSAIIIPSSNYVKLDLFQRFINYSALGLLYICIWTGLNFLLSLLFFGKEHGTEIRSLISITAFIGLFMYVIQMQVIHFQMLHKKDEDEDENDNDNHHENDSDVHHQLAGSLPLHEKNNGNEEEGILERIAVKTGQKIHVILVPDIVYIQSDGDYVQIVTGQSRYLKEETMKYFEASLPRTKFVRVHRSYIVNVEKILRIELYEKQNQMLTLKNGDQIRASVSGYKELRAKLNL